MGIIKSENLIHEYIKKDENDNIEEVFRALDRINLDVNTGEFIGILGHNGSGKSTIAKHINALLLPTEGCIWVDGIDTKDQERVWDIRQTAGMVFQNPDNQIIGTVVEEDVAFGPENIGVPTDEIWKRVEDSLTQVEMLEYRKHSPNRLSGGQKQRVAIAGVLAMKPKCIVLDEPTAMLDPIGRNEVIETIKMLNKKEKVTVILITHFMNEVVDADKVIIMEKGRISLQGSPKEVFSKVDKIKELGLSLPTATWMAHELRCSGIDIKEGILRIEELVDEICRLSLKM